MRSCRRRVGRKLHGFVRILRMATGLGSLAPTAPARLRIVGLCLLMSVGRHTRDRPQDVGIEIEVGHRSFRFLVADRSELEALYEVVVEDEYRLPRDLDPHVIVDLGSHVGSSVVAFKAAYPAARILAVEPDPRTFARLRRNISSFTDVACVNAAVAAVTGTRTLYRQEGQSWASSLLPSANARAAVDVEVLTLDEVLARHEISKIDILKFDVEGAEWELFPFFAGMKTVEYLLGEVHFTPEHHAFDAVLRLLDGFEVEIVREDKYGGIIKARRRALAGQGRPVP